MRVLVRGLMKPVSAHTGYIHQAKPEYVPFNPYGVTNGPCTGPQDYLGTFYVHTIVGSPCLNVLHALLLATAILQPKTYGPKNLRKIVRVLVRGSVKTVSARTC